MSACNKTFHILPTIPQTFLHFWIPHFTFHIPHCKVLGSDQRSEDYRKIDSFRSQQPGAWPRALLLAARNGQLPAKHQFFMTDECVAFQGRFWLPGARL